LDKILTNDGEDESVAEVSVKSQLDQVLSQQKCSNSLHETHEYVLDKSEGQGHIYYCNQVPEALLIIDEVALCKIS